MLPQFVKDFINFFYFLLVQPTWAECITVRYTVQCTLFVQFSQSDLPPLIPPCLESVMTRFEPGTGGSSGRNTDHQPHFMLWTLFWGISGSEPVTLHHWLAVLPLSYSCAGSPTPPTITSEEYSREKYSYDLTWTVQSHYPVLQHQIQYWYKVRI